MPRAGSRAERPDVEAGVVDRIERLAYGARDWLFIELRLFRARLLLAGKSYATALSAFIVAAIVMGTGIVFLAVGVALALAPVVGQAWAYVLIAIAAAVLSAALLLFGLRAINGVTLFEPSRTGRDME